MKNILLPTDFSDNAWNAAKYAIEIFREEECTFYLLNTYTPQMYRATYLDGAPMERGLNDLAAKNALSELERIKNKIKKELPNKNHRLESITSCDILIDKIKSIVVEKKIDLIVTGTKGATNAIEIFMGSNTVNMIKSVTSCPVLAIPEDFGFITPSEIAFATDFNHFYSKNELEPLIEMAKLFKATIRIVYIEKTQKELSEQQQFNLNMLQKYLGEIPSTVYQIPEKDSVSETLKNFTKELDIYLLAMLYYKHSFIERLTREPIVKRIGFHTQIPFLVIPEIGMSDAFTKEKKKETPKLA
ncbi:universal stress protein [Aquimarina hainanensis]|uniref:Universal stress protein n=1 Tax=Aquimarina hainanensis TaxID=1578017 RepID=A0ABW5N1L0_9FLAO|nr:universal stress protein [Aquimarina sp. TRL1]QKX04386.1 universal stress protein [Aquimarina sp. TRL1]